jgi:hypothetical protein
MTYLDKIRKGLSFDSSGNDRYTDIHHFLKNYPQKINQRIRYLVAGSWAIEFLTGKRLSHKDIDIIVIQNPLWYLDNAKTKEEKCDGVIPLSNKYFDNRNIIKCTKINKNIYVPDINLQICFKFIGELNPHLSKRAILQLKLLFEYAGEFNGIKKENILQIVQSCTPSILDHKNITAQIIYTSELYQQEKYTEWIKKINAIHKKINSALQKSFKNKNMI